MAIRISLVDDHDLTREVLVDLIRKTPLLRFLASYSDSASALAGLPLDPPDVVLMDINLPNLSGIECVRRLKPLLPKTQFLMLTVNEDAENIFKALAAGATGYLLKSTRQQDLVAGIRQIHAGGSPMTAEIARKVVRSFATDQDASPKIEVLSAREQEVLGLLAQGSLYKEIAAALHVGIPTVCTHVRHIYKKLQVHSRGQVAAKYFSSRPEQPPPSA
jgi:DNA-binding NarL/FixJ family response regulator